MTVPEPWVRKISHTVGTPSYRYRWLRNFFACVETSFSTEYEDDLYIEQLI